MNSQNRDENLEGNEYFLEGVKRAENDKLYIICKYFSGAENISITINDKEVLIGKVNNIFGKEGLFAVQKRVGFEVFEKNGLAALMKKNEGICIFRNKLGEESIVINDVSLISVWVGGILVYNEFLDNIGFRGLIIAHSSQRLS